MYTKRDNVSLGCAGLAPGSTSGLKITNAFPYRIAGRTYQKAATDNVAFLFLPGSNALINVAANQITFFNIHIDIAGNIYTSQARVVPAFGSAGYVPGGFTPRHEEPQSAGIGSVKVVTGASGSFVPGTTAYNAAGVTSTFYNYGTDYGVPVPF